MDRLTCNTCNESYDGNRGHDCPGPLYERVQALEAKVAELEKQTPVPALERIATALETLAKCVRPID